MGRGRILLIFAAIFVAVPLTAWGIAWALWTLVHAIGVAGILADPRAL